MATEATPRTPAAKRALAREFIARALGLLAEADLADADEVAEADADGWLRVSRHPLRRALTAAIRAGESELETAKLNSRVVLVRASSVERWLRARDASTRSGPSSASREQDALLAELGLTRRTG